MMGARPVLVSIVVCIAAATSASGVIAGANVGAAAGAGAEAGAEAGAGNARGATAVDDPAWAFTLTAYPTRIRSGESYTSAIAVAERGALHLEARYNYEAIGARSAFVGWTFSGGDTVAWTVTPLLGGAWNGIQAIVPGLEISVAWKRFDFYVEAEYVRDRRNERERYLYSWSELGFRPIEPLRVGAAVQRTRTYGGDRDLQIGPFVQWSARRITFGAYWFNPGSADQVFVASIGTSF
jgi:hypothetical protein